MEEQLIGTVTHYFNKIGVAAVKLTDGELGVGDKVHLKGNTTDFSQEVNSIQIEHQMVQKATSGNEIGIKVNEKVHEGDEVYKVIE